MLEVDLGTWTDARKRSLLVSVPGLLLYGLVLVVPGTGRGNGTALAVQGAVWLALAVLYAYWMAVGALNRWKIVANEEGVIATYGPLPWIWRERLIPASSITRFLLSESIGDSGSRYHQVLTSAYGIDVLEPDGYTLSLVQGCGDKYEISRVKRTLEEHFGVAQPDR